MFDRPIDQTCAGLGPGASSAGSVSSRRQPISRRAVGPPISWIDTGTLVLAAVSVMSPPWPGSLRHRHDQHSLCW